VACAHVPPDPSQADIRYVKKLIAGGRGLGGRQGFDTLRSIAGKLGAGVAASRMAVDLGWIESARQVGQTGKTVRPDLYLACGISGASHHLEGMSDSRHVVAINTDANAPLMRRAELAIQADLHQVLARLDELLGDSGEAA
jgi:electron transfer flavoprotein alpha subunit